MISIPDDPQLIAELSLPLYQFTGSGKIRIEGKEDMRRRGVKSPDRADALMYSFAPGGPNPGGYASAGEPRPCEPPPARRSAGGGYAAADGGRYYEPGRFSGM